MFGVNSVGIVTGYGLDGPGSISGNARFSLLHSLKTDSGAHPVCGMGTGGSFPGVKRQEHEAEHSSPSSVEVKTGGAVPPIPHMSPWCSV
jgi:hypothetical protein